MRALSTATGEPRQEPFERDQSRETMKTIHTHTHTPCSNTLFGWTWAASLLLRNATDVSAGLCLSPFIKSCGCWLRSTGRTRTASDVLLLPKMEKRANECSWGGGGGVTWGSDWGRDVMDSIKSKHTASWQRLNNGLSLLHLFTGFCRGRKQLLRLCVRIKVKINWRFISKWGPRGRSLFKHGSIVSGEPRWCWWWHHVALRDAAWTQIQLMKKHNRTAEICHY